MRIALPLLQHRTATARPGVRGAPAGALPRTLIDSYGRQIRDLRLSLTDRCNFRCVYCMEPDVRFMRRVDLLTDAELLRIARVFRGFGVDRLRLTGGEPTLFPHLSELIGELSSLGFADLAMTTNGSVADSHEMRRWKAAGLRRLSISLDTLRDDRFTALTRSTGSPARVLESIADAIAAGLGPIKVNAVIMRGVNEDEVSDFARLARELDIEVRLIEFMPLDSGRRWSEGSVVTADEMIERISREIPIVDDGRERLSSPATRFRFADTSRGRLGIIASVSRPFCGACSRSRVTADGKLMPCLFSRSEWDLRSVMRSGGTDADLARTIVDATTAKQAGHGFTRPDYVQPDRPMSAIGG